jgi:hypothetical protein
MSPRTEKIMSGTTQKSREFQSACSQGSAVDGCHLFLSDAYSAKQAAIARLFYER